MALPEAPTAKGHRAGTHRACAPADTLARVVPMLPGLGITRCADVTGLDRIGIPVYTAIRPGGHYLQTSTGKGLEQVDAKVSALMEGLEHWHAERVPAGARAATAHALGSERARVVVDGATLPSWRSDVHTGPDRVQQWLKGEDLVHGAPAWIPAGAACVPANPQFFLATTNGLASGNTIDEATLHALCEVIERDVVTRLVRNGRLRLTAPECRRVRNNSVGDAGVGALLEQIREAGLDVSLVQIAAPAPCHVFWAALLDPSPFHPSTRVNFGFGAHLSPAVAAVRAITEAAQARLSFIHGAREDLAFKIRNATDALVRPVADYFGALPELLEWPELDDAASDDLRADLGIVLGALRAAGREVVYRADLTHAAFGVPVVKVLVPGTVANGRLF